MKTDIEALRKQINNPDEWWERRIVDLMNPDKFHSIGGPSPADWSRLVRERETVRNVLPGLLDEVAALEQRAERLNDLYQAVLRDEDYRIDAAIAALATEEEA